MRNRNNKEWGRSRSDRLCPLIPSAILLILVLAACSSTEPEHYGDQSFSGDSTTLTAIDFAKRQLGKPYRPGGSSPANGFDCSGLVHYAFQRAGLNVPRTTSALYNSTFPVDLHALHRGDLLFFRIEGKVSHVGIYVGEGRFIHAPSSGKQVSYASLDSPYWREHLVHAGRLF